MGYTYLFTTIMITTMVRFVKDSTEIANGYSVLLLMVITLELASDSCLLVIT